MGLFGEFPVLAAAGPGRVAVPDGSDHHRRGSGGTTPARSLGTHHRESGTRQHHLHWLFVLHGAIDRSV